MRFRLPGGGQSGPAGAPSVLIAYGDNNVRALERCGIPGYLVRLSNAEQAATALELGLRLDYPLQPKQTIFLDISSTQLPDEIKRSPIVGRSNLSRAWAGRRMPATARRDSSLLQTDALQALPAA